MKKIRGTIARLLQTTEDETATVSCQVCRSVRASGVNLEVGKTVLTDRCLSVKSIWGGHGKFLRLGRNNNYYFDGLKK